VRIPAQRGELMRGQGPVVAVVAAGGAVGAVARYGAALAWPTAVGDFPTTTFVVNAVGCAVIGVFMVVLAEAWPAHRLVRPFFGRGVLGGFTTFSTYAVDIRQLIDSGHPGTALAYLVATVVAALAAVWAAAALTRRALARLVQWRQR
jgi:CrcB protein